MKGDGYSPLAEPQVARTDMTCTECSKKFIAELDFRIDGNHVVECPHCGHDHFRLIENGKITEERWKSGIPTTRVGKGKVIKVEDGLEMRTSTAAQFIRDAWLNRSGLSP